MKNRPNLLAAAAAISLLGITPACADTNAHAETETDLAQDEADSWTGYRAHGTEPFWSLSITETQMNFDASGVFTAEANRPEARNYFEGTVFMGRPGNTDGGEFIVLVEERACTDGMADMAWPHEVRILVDGRFFLGCGGEPSALVIGDEWRVATVAGEEVPESMNLTIQFDAEGRVSGFGGCNRFTGSYVMDGGVEIGPLAATQRACINPDISRFETALFTALGEVFGLGMSDDGMLILFGGNNPEPNGSESRALTARR